MIRRLWEWVKAHFTALPEPEATKEKQADPQGAFAGFKWPF